ncbi:MAG: hypothetical protein AAFX87_10495 [Bacteroidota bacterium]
MRALFVIPILLLLVSCSESNQETDSPENNLNGKVKSITKMQYTAEESFGKVDGKRLQQGSKLVFNKYGKLIKKFSTDLKGKLYLEASYKYDRNRNLVARTDYDSDGTSGGKYTYTYDSEGQMTTEKYENPLIDDVIDKATFSYDQAGSLIQKDNHVGDDLSSRIMYKYDDQGNLVEESDYDADGSLSLRNYYKYDKDGNQTENTLYSDNGKALQKYTRSYNNNGQILREVRHVYHNNIRLETSFKYDQIGNVIEEDETKTTGSKERNRKKSYEYNYDEKNNATKVVEFVNGKASTLTEIKLEYFD